MNSPFNQEQIELLNHLLPTLTEAQKIWLSGYLSAHMMGSLGTTVDGQVLSQGVAAVPRPARNNVVSEEVTVLFGSQSGNSQGLAKGFSRKLEERGFKVTLTSMSDFKPSNLKNIRNLLIVVSTHGEGDPPDNAQLFYEFLHGKRAPRLESLRYSVLALGDSSYEFFCKTGKDFDKRLEELGGVRQSPRVDCDLDFDEPAAAWFESVLTSLNGIQEVSAGVAEGSTATVVRNAPEAETVTYSRTNPFHAEVLENINLNGGGSNRETRHLEISLEGSGLQYEPGDCLGIYPQNHPELVDSLINAMGWDPDEIVVVNKKGDERKLREALRSDFEITVLTKPMLEQAAQLSSNDGLRELLASGHEQELKNYLKGRDLMDLVQDFSLRGVPAGEFVSILRKMPARLYSIASSSKAHPDEVHVTIRTVRYQANGRERYGVCSVFCAERLQPGDTLPVYIHHNPNFKLPADLDTPVIMIGPGTGVAPFRSFLAEREEIGAKGKTWLLYGDQHFRTDFLYQLDWQNWLKNGVLTKMDVAFSRDTAEKVYVQHRMLEKSKEFYRWLQEGAHVYVCGDEKNMAHDVHAALIAILEQEGGMSQEAAQAYLAEMQQQKRYQRDVY
ncbi:assimilatory sulfite reductase (NADPH) flavoprotein subunit [Fodinisporobacter ferrooxydans]